MNSPNVELTHKLTRIWERVLRRSPIGGDDNFFDLGGNPSLAAALCSEIASSGERELSPLMLYQAPTIGTLAAVLEQQSAARISPLPLLKKGDPGLPPVFITHGIGGTVMEFFELVKRIETSRSIYGMQARGIDGVDEPLDRIEAMAEYFLGAVKAVQARGPYLLVGYSLGGLVTLEMARRLGAGGNDIGLLALLEAYPHRGYLPLSPRVDLFLRLARYHISTAARLPLRSMFPYVAGKVKSRRGLAGEIEPAGRGRLSAIRSAESINRNMTRSAFLALKGYRPLSYEGRVRFVRAEISLRFPKNPTAVWSKLLPRLEVETVPGDHQSMVTEHFDRLAPVLSRYLKEVPA